MAEVRLAGRRVEEQVEVFLFHQQGLLIFPKSSTEKRFRFPGGTITIKGENGKTSGLVRIDRVSDMSPRDKFEVKSAADKAGVNLTDNGMSNFYYDKGSKQLYFMNNTRSNYLYEHEKGSTMADYGDYVSKQTTLRAMESKGVIIVNHK